MIEGRKTKNRNKLRRMSNAEIMVILILFHLGSFRCLKHYHKEYICKYLRHLFLHQMSYNRFVCNQRILIHKTLKGLLNVENIQWNSSSDSGYI